MMREAGWMALGLLCLAAMMGFCLLVMGAAGDADATARPDHPYCEHAP